MRFSLRLDPSGSRLFASQARIASRLVWLPSITIRSRQPCRLSALLRKRLAAAKFRRSLNQNSTESPLPTNLYVRPVTCHLVVTARLHALKRFRRPGE